MNAYTLYAVNIDNAGAGTDLFIDQVSDFSFDPAINALLLGSDGAVDPTYVAVMSQSPSMALSTSALATVLAACGISGLSVVADADEFGADFYLQKLLEGGTRAVGNSHLRMRSSKGMLIPLSLTASQGALATLSMSYVPIFDGTLDPVVISNIAPLVGAPAVGEAFTLGPVYVNGAQVEGVQSVTINFGISLEVIGSDGGVWPTFVSIGSRRPTISVETTDASILNTFGLTGAAQAATDSAVYFTKMAEGSTRVADLTAEHISFTVDAGHIGVGAISATHPGRASAGLTITPTYDGTNAIIAISTATALP